MKKRIAIVLAAASMAVAADRTFTGTITDTMCGASHKGMNMGTDPQCVIECEAATSTRYGTATRSTCSATRKAQPPSLPRKSP